jgi:hypothetical protein
MAVDGQVEEMDILKMLLERFRMFLNSSSKYDVKNILERMNDSWMLEEQVMLLIKMDDRKTALEKYIERSMHHEAEEFCAKQDPD